MLTALSRALGTASRRSPSLKQTWKDCIHRPSSRLLGSMASQKITFKSNHKAGDGEGVVFGDLKSQTRGLIVIHEWWGLNDQIQQEGDEINKQSGLAVLVPDMYRGKVATDNETAGHYMADLDWPGAVEDVRGAAQWMLANGCSKVGVTGFCMGGALAFLGALHVDEISAAAPFYGIPSPKEQLANLKKPIQAHFGTKDEAVGFTSPADYKPLKELLEKAGVDMEWYEYEAGHAFTNPSSPTYNKEICNLALGRMYEFMNRRLG